MKHLYVNACRNYGCKAKVFTQMKAELKYKIGSPDLMIFFTNTVSHKLVNCALTEAKRCSAKLERSHSSSLSALKNILSSYCGEKANEKNI